MILPWTPPELWDCATSAQEAKTPGIVFAATVHHPNKPDGRGKASLSAFFPFPFATTEPA